MYACTLLPHLQDSLFEGDSVVAVNMAQVCDVADEKLGRLGLARTTFPTGSGDGM